MQHELFCKHTPRGCQSQTTEDFSMLQRAREACSAPDKATSWAAPNDKIQCFEEAVSRLASGGGKCQSRMAALATRFDVSLATKGSTEELLQRFYSADTRQIDLVSADDRQVLTFADPKLIASFGASRDWGNGPEMLPGHAKEGACHLLLHLRVNPSRLHPAVAVSCCAWSLAVTLPLTDAGSVHALLARATLWSPQEAVKEIQFIAGAEPEIGALSKPSGTAMVKISVS